MASSLSSISGLSSGLDTASIVSQLMQIEAIGQTTLKTRMSAEKSTLTSLQELNTAIAALTTKAEGLSLSAAWSPLRISSSSPLATVVPSGTASTGSSAAGSFGFTVGQRAQAHQLTFSSPAALTDPVTSGGSVVRLTKADGTTTDLETGNGTLGGLVGALNGAGTGLRASTLRLDDGTYRLSVTSATSGEDSVFTLTDLDGTDLLGGATVSAAGQDASITIGADTVTSSTNTFTDVMPGTSITLESGAVTGTVVDVAISSDADAMTATVKELVDQVNAALEAIDGLTGYNSATSSSGALSGDAGVRSLRNSLLTAVYPGDGTSMAGFGLQVDRYGQLAFDEDKFQAAYAADPGAVAAAFTTGATSVDNGFAARVASVGEAASDSIGGTLTMSIKSRGDGITRMQKSIEDWDVRLELRRSHLERQFTALETALSSLNSQSSWLTSQMDAMSSSES